MSTVLQQAVIAEKLTDLSDLTVKLTIHQDKLLLKRVNDLIYIIIKKYTLLTSTDGRKSKKFKDTKELLNKSFASTVENIRTRTEAILAECRGNSITHYVNDGNPIIPEPHYENIRVMYMEVLEVCLRLILALTALEG